jgi:hypothetical protein
MSDIRHKFGRGLATLILRRVLDFTFDKSLARAACEGSITGVKAALVKSLPLETLPLADDAVEEVAAASSSLDLQHFARMTALMLIRTPRREAAFPSLYFTRNKALENVMAMEKGAAFWNPKDQRPRSFRKPRTRRSSQRDQVSQHTEADISGETRTLKYPRDQRT